MNDAKDILNGMSNEEISLYTARPEEEPHIVVDENRFITVPEELKRIAVQWDHHIETVTFDCPRYWDEHDMSKMVVYINYLCSDGHVGMYKADNVRVDSENDRIMHFEWTVTQNATSADGPLAFLVCVKEVVSAVDNTLRNHWNSELCYDMYISKGLEVEEEIVEKYADIITQIITSNEVINNQIQIIFSKLAEFDDVSDEIDKIKIDISELIQRVTEVEDRPGRYWYNENDEKKGEIYGDYENNVASAEMSTASGFMTKATGVGSNASGNGTVASGEYSNASGFSSAASGIASNAYNMSSASGDYSNSFGTHTEASGDNQITAGKYNIVDSNNEYIFILGNGNTNSNRSNAFTVDWNGNIVSGGDSVATKTNGESVSLLETADLANNLSIYSKNLSTNIYINASTGNDDNDGLSSAKPLKTLDRAFELAGYYRDVTILLAEGYTYAATDKTNVYGTGIHLYDCSIKLMSDESSSVKVQNAIFVYNGRFEMKNIDLKSSNSGITLYNSFGNFENSTMQSVNPNNCVITMNNCTTPYILQRGGHTSVYGGTLGSIQVENGGYLNFAYCKVTGYVSAPPSMICQNGVPVYMAQAKRIAEESVKTITRYVNASSGSNSSPGTESAPYRTLDAALSDVMYAKKAIIYLAAGTYSIPNKIVTWINQDVRIYGNAKEDTIIKGNIVAENSFLRLKRVTVDSTDSETANTSENTITAQYGTILRMDSCIVNTSYNTCVNCTETSKSYLTNCTFSGALQYAVYTTGFGDVRIYQCSDDSEKGVRSGGGSVVNITNSSSGTEFPYTNGNYGIVYVNGQQVLPQVTT